jgi:tetratricopeptide (TPR) repeat protein
MHLLNARGKGESDEADAIAEASEEPWNKLSPEERARINGLSADLHMLTGDEVHEKTELSQEQLTAALREAWQREDAVAMLSLLRKGPTWLKDHQIAYWRWKYFHALGHVETAVLFLEYAAKAAPSEGGYTISLLHALIDAGRKPEAIQMARSLLSSQETRPNLQIAAAVLLAGALRSEVQQGSVSEWRNLANVLKRAAAAETVSPPGTNHETKVRGLLLLTYCYTRTGNTFLAQQALNEACALDPTIRAALGNVDPRDPGFVKKIEGEPIAAAQKEAEAEAFAVT